MTETFEHDLSPTGAEDAAEEVEAAVRRNDEENGVSRPSIAETRREVRAMFRSIFEKHHGSGR
jgi:hypothetical protein